MTKKLFLSLVMAILLSHSAFAGMFNSNYSNSGLLKQSEDALLTGHVYDALNLLEKAQQHSNDPEERQLISIAFSDAFLRNGQVDEAEKKLNAVYAVIKSVKKSGLLSEIMQRFGHIAIARNNTLLAVNWYQQAVIAAKQSGDHAQIAATLINLSTVQRKNRLLSQAAVNIRRLQDQTLQHPLLLSLGHQATQQGQIALAQQALQTVLKHAISSRLKSQAQGLMGELYAQRKRMGEALYLTEQALLSDNSPDLKLQWNWQRARLLVLDQQPEAALLAYRSAVLQLQQLRIDIPVVYHNGESSFNQTFAPLYTEFIANLLQQAEKVESIEKQQFLSEVVKIWEELKAVELQDYFRDTCVVKQNQNTSVLDAHTAMLYPILLSDRLALVVRFADQIKTYTVKKKPSEVAALVEQISHAISVGDSLFKQSKTLYQWLIAPLAADLNQQEIRTLVYLPDGSLRQIPFGLLHDGQNYLTEIYALVTVPGLSMLSAPSKTIIKNDILLAGMSVPGPVVEELLNIGIDFFDVSTEEKRGLPIKKRGLKLLRQATILQGKERALRANRMKQLLVLPGVSEELKILSSISQVQVMENNDFLRDNFKKEVRQGHSVVHIASHGYFSGDPEKSFIMTYDYLLNMKQMAELFQNEAFNNRPIELVTLSACQTAEGDDRSPLGLSGVVVQTGVKSAIGTLWSVADKAAKQFFSEFYTYYQKPGVSKVEAVQHAQKKLLHNPEFAHPFYWAPFILVGEWH